MPTNADGKTFGIMKKVCLFILLSLYFATVCAGFDLQTAIPLVETKTLPLDFNRELAFRANHCLDNPNNAIPDKMYENFQLTDSFSTRDNTDTMLNLCFKCKLSSDLYLCLVRIGGVIEPVTYVLTSVDYNYRVMQSLKVGVKYANTYIKQFRITDNREVYVYRLVPTSTASVLFDTFKSVEAYVTETVYTIDSAGQFILASPEKRVSSTRTFSHDELENMKQNLWELY